jgi:hypothetical protein
MNKVSWRRILQRAGHEFPNETGAAIIPMQDAHRLARQGSRSPGEPKAGVLESELKRTLDRAARREHETKATRKPPRWEPVFMTRDGGGPARGTGGELREISGPAPLPAVRVKPEPAKRPSSGGGRNILAIFLSAAVVGIAYQQISTEWNQSRATGSGVGVAPERTNRPANALFSSASIDDSQAGYGVQPRGPETQAAPSHRAAADGALAPAASETKRRDSFPPGIEQAPGVLATSGLQQPDPVAPVSAPIKHAGLRELAPGGISAADEQSMLRRAHELIQRGHLFGARLIFEHLALQQSALGAFALAETYDEKFLKTLRVEGQHADLALAEKWYRRAAELGAQSADRH